MKYLTVTGKIKLNKYGKIELTYDQELLNFLNKLNFNISVLNTDKKLNYKALKKSKGLIISGGGNIYKISNHITMK